VGHLNPKVELAKVLLRRGMAVVIDVVDSPDAMGRLAARRVPERPLEEVQRGPESASRILYLKTSNVHLSN